jgi:Leucine-rich repeat (LRR) protein
MSKNKLSSINYFPKNLKEIIAYSNIISSICNYPEYLNKIDLYNNNLETIPDLTNNIKWIDLSSNDLKISSPLASTVKTSEIFGRVFKDSEMIWRVILTNSSTESVPPINGIQFRLVGYEEAGWVSLPYKLKKDSRSNSVYAAVDDLFLSVLFKKPVCPEFRAVREENGKLVNIWTKGKPECSNDYLP